MNPLRRFDSLSIRSKLMFAVMGVHIVLMTLFVVDMVQRQRVFLLQEATSGALKQASLTADAVSSWVLTEDVAGMAEVLQSSRKDSPTRYAFIMDTRGQVLAHSDRELGGSFVIDPVALSLMEGPIGPLTWRTDDKLIQVAAPILVEGQVLGWVLLGLDTAPTYAHLRSISLDGFIYTLAAMCAGAVAAWLMAKIILRQLGLMLQGADRLRENKLEPPIPIVNRDEIGRVAEALNRAMESLLLSREEIQREIQERHHAEQRIHYLSQRLMDGSEEERRRIGHDLHDELGQIVTGFQFGLHSLQSMVDEGDIETKNLCQKLVDYAEEMGETVGRIATHSWPIALEHLGLSIAARSFVEECASRHPHLHMTFSADLPDQRLEPRLELACYRVLQEAVNNIIRHSGAKNANIRLHEQAGCIVLHVRDDGHGFDAQAALNSGHEEFSGIGLIGMHERAVAVGGHMEVVSSSGGGCTLEAFFPLVFRSICVPATAPLSHAVERTEQEIIAFAGVNYA